MNEGENQKGTGQTSNLIGTRCVSKTNRFAVVSSLLGSPNQRFALVFGHPSLLKPIPFRPSWKGVNLKKRAYNFC